MRLATVIHDDIEQCAVITAHGLTLVSEINARLGKAWPTDLLRLLEQGLSHAIESDAFAVARYRDPRSMRFAPLYRHPRKIWGIASITGITQRT